MSNFLSALKRRVSGVERVLTDQCDDYNVEEYEDDFKDLVKYWNKQNEEAIKYINRLSDLFFVLSRVENNNGKKDILWKPGKNV